MAWIKFINQNSSETYADLEAIPIITHEPKSEQFNLWLGSGYFTLSKKKSPEVYQQVFDYLARKISNP